MQPEMCQKYVEPAAALLEARHDRETKDVKERHDLEIHELKSVHALELKKVSDVHDLEKTKVRDRQARESYEEHRRNAWNKALSRSAHLEELARADNTK